MRHGHDAIERFSLDACAFAAYGLANCSSSGVIGQRPDRRVVEQTLGVRFRFSRQCGYLRQARTEEHQRQAPLRDPVQGNDQRAQVFFVEVLNFVDKKGDARVGCFGRLTDREEEFRKIDLQVSAVRSSALFSAGARYCASRCPSGASSMTT